MDIAKREVTATCYALIVSTATTGLMIFLPGGHHPFFQWSLLAHALLAIALTPVLTLYFYQHFLKTVGFRRPSLIATGLFTFLLFLGFLASGWHLLLYGQFEDKRWILATHIWCSFAFILVIVIHIIFHVFTLPEKRRKRDESMVPSADRNTSKTVLVTFASVLATVCIATLLYSINLDEYSTAGVVDAYEFTYGPHPFRPSQTETLDQQFIDERLIAESHRCITCHTDIGKQWYSSVHRQAASDPTYETNINLLVNNKGISAARYCEGCHAPVALLSGQLTPGGTHGGVDNSTANIEGVSCLSCHSIEKVLHLKGVAAYEFIPHQPYLFAHSNNPLLARLHDHLLRLNPDQHRRDMGNKILHDSSFCSTCHTQFMDKDMNNWGWVKMQDEYGAWLESPFSKQHQEMFANNDVTRCHDCHMPLVASDDPSANNQGMIRAHHFPGANTFLPIINGDKKQLEETMRFLQGNKIKVSIVKPERSDVPQSKLALDEAVRTSQEANPFYYLGEKANIEVVVSNQGVGHDFPGGTIDLGEAWLEFVVSDAEGSIIYSEGLLDEDRHVDADAYFYRSLPVDRHGDLVWRHDLFNMVGESFKRIIKAGESDIIKVEFDIPAWTKGPITVTASLNYRKLNQRYAEWALSEEYVDIPVITMGWDTLQLAIKKREKSY